MTTLEQLSLAVRQIWLTVRSNKYFVAFEGGVYGAFVNYASEGLMTGKLDFSKAGLEKMLAFMLTGGATAVQLLLRPAPGAPPNQK
jgi:hypothetical protein